MRNKINSEKTKKETAEKSPSQNGEWFICYNAEWQETCRFFKYHETVTEQEMLDKNKSFKMERKK